MKLRYLVSGLTAGLTALLVATAPTAGASVTPGAQSPSPSATGQSKLIQKTYIVTNPALVANPGQLIAAVKPNGSFAPKMAPNAAPAAVPAGNTFVINSSRYARGRQPSDPYQYITKAECLAHINQAVRNEGWIKNSYSYCQTYAILKVAVTCDFLDIFCHTDGVFAATPVLIGYGKVGPYRSGSYDRWADFQITMNILRATGPYANPATTLSVHMDCRGFINHHENKSACHPGAANGRDTSVDQWRAHDGASMQLVSDARKPGPKSPQVSVGVYQPMLSMDLFGGYQNVGASMNGRQGGMRFDSAYYLAPQALSSQMGSIFDRAEPGFEYDISNDAVTGVAKHIKLALTNPGATVPTAAGKKIPGASSNPVHRLAPGAGAAQNTRYNANRTTTRAFCTSPQMPPRPPGQAVQCDEFPFASTYEGSARWRYDGARYRNWYSVQWVDTTQNLEAGRELGAWYLNQRILDKEAGETRNGFYMVIGN